jgi:hypothetical protein
MKYIKLFERLTLAKRQQQETDLDEFTKIHLAYLADEGFDVYAIDYSNVSVDSEDYRGLHTSILLSNHSTKRFTCEEISDRFIPYLYMLNKEYNILEIVFYGYSKSKVKNGTSKYRYDKKEIEQIISGEIDLTDKFYTNIRIIVKG